jgi:ATP-dependent DNA helicase RecQ
VGLKNKRIHDIGAIRSDGAVYHHASKQGLVDFIRGVGFICGHNIIHHDAKYLFGDEQRQWQIVDTLYMSPLMFPERPYHRLLKDDKLMSDQVNNPVNDCEKARDLLFDEVEHWHSLSENKRRIFASLLRGKPEFDGFLNFVGAEGQYGGLAALIQEEYEGLVCSHAPFDTLISLSSCELAYALALIDTTDYRSVTPGWVLRNYPEVEYVMKLLRQTPCGDGCTYCHTQLDLHYNLEAFFGYKKFRTFEGENLQEKAAQAAVRGRSLLAIFPTGGGKSLTFQLPALMEGRTLHGLTVVISPLQSLMKDQVDNLAERGITDAVTINGLLDPISRSKAIQRVRRWRFTFVYFPGDASL